MRNASICLLASVLAFSGCEKKKEILVTETRPVTTSDPAPKTFATSDQRFRDTKPSPVKATTPEGWREVPGSQFRMLNYKFGASGAGEAWVTLAAGSVLDNTNRWLKQFGMPPLDAGGLAKLKPVLLAGGEGVWVSAQGNYEGGMGAPPKTDFALSGVIAMVGDKILTVKMVGPKDEVAAAKESLETFVASVRLGE